MVFIYYGIYNYVQIMNFKLLLIHHHIKRHSVTQVDYLILHQIHIDYVYWAKDTDTHVFVTQRNTCITHLVSYLFRVSRVFF